MSGSLDILFADDEENLQHLMANELPRMGHRVTVCRNGAEARAAMDRQRFDVAIFDLKMPDTSGVDLLAHLKQTSPDTEAMILTGHATVETAVEALRLGAFDYLCKPFRLTEIAARLDRIADRRDLAHKAIALETRVKAAEGPLNFVGRTEPMQRIGQLIDTVAPTTSSVLIQGETGTGKELVARILHYSSRRSQMPFVPVNCGALPEHLVESELFGHRKGAFTGADLHHKGLFEVADGGTLLLDEVGELDRGIQVKLLRFLESGEIRRVGETSAFRSDVRVLCSSNRDLKQAVADGQFREDLYFRINTFEIVLPPLRDRRGDIPLLAEHFLDLLAHKGHVPWELADRAMEVLCAHDWPGNVRELANVLEHAYVLAGGKPLSVEHLPPMLRTGVPNGPSGPMTLREKEMAFILDVLHQHDGNKPAAAEELGISLKTLYNKLNQADAARSASGERAGPK